MFKKRNQGTTSLMRCRHRLAAQSRLIPLTRLRGVSIAIIHGQYIAARDFSAVPLTARAEGSILPVREDRTYSAMVGVFQFSRVREGRPGVPDNWGRHGP